MMNRFVYSCFCVFLALCGSACPSLFCDECADSDLMRDLLIVDYWNQRLAERFPVMYNYVFSGGYFAMPSARMGADGEIGLGYAYVPPYRNYNLRCQILGNVEITGSYRVFHGVEDPVLSKYGFGDFSDKGANFKLAILHPEDSDYKLPGLAFGIEDFMGTKGFHARYVVLTQVFLEQNLELTLGWGAGRFKGFFGGGSWMPFRRTDWRWLRPLCISAEYDCIPYHDETIEKHPKGRVKKTPINMGVKYRLGDYVDLSLAYMRGDALAFSVSGYYNWGYTKGFLPKIEDPLPYKAPVNFEPLGIHRSEESLIAELTFAFGDQGLTMLDAYLSYNDCNEKVLRLGVLNETYMLEQQVRERLNALISSLIPSDIADVVVVIYSEGFPIQEYHYHMDWVRLLSAKEICSFEFNMFTPMTEVTPIDPCTSSQIFYRKRGLYNFEVSPETHTLFGSSRGKFKYALGLQAAFNGFLWQDIYYNILVGWTFATNMSKVNDYDILNPSQLPNVNTDAVNYYKHRGLSLDEAYLQKNWNLGKGFYARLSAGYFQESYGGAATELLYYPVHSPFAISIEGAVLKKRKYTGIGFSNTIRQMVGYRPTYHKFLGSQYFVSLYYDWEWAHLDFKVQAGKFLANDWGVRNEISRYFPSGLRLTVWYTLTNGNDKINGKTYYDKGVGFSMPLDIFYTRSERSRWSNYLSAWLRDVGYQSMTGLGLYELINDQRQ